MNLIVRSAAALIGLAALAWLSGFLLPARHEASVSMRLKADPEAVWAVLAAVEDYPQWRSDVAVSEVVRRKPALAWKQTDPRGSAIMHAEGPGRHAEKWIDQDSGGTPPVKGERVFLIIAGKEGGSTIALTETAEIKDPLARFKARFITGYSDDLKKLMDELRKRMAE